LLKNCCTENRECNVDNKLKERKKERKKERNCIHRQAEIIRILVNKANSAENSSPIPLSSIEPVCIHKRTFDGKAFLP